MMNAAKWELLKKGAFIPANPLVLDENRQLDTRRQRALVRYYLDAGVDGLAVGVHTTQFAIRQHGLFEPVLKISADVAAKEAGRTLLMVAGVCGPTEQAVREAQIARDLGYDLVLVSCGGLPGYTEDELIERAKKVADVLPVFGFYLQPAAGGRLLSRDYWRRLADIPGVAAIKMAPFNRYQTMDVVRGVMESQRCDDITLYTGNDDNIIVDLLTPYCLEAGGQLKTKRIMGGLLGHWSVWTKNAVEYFHRVKAIADSGAPIDPEIMTLAAQVTDANAAFFDTDHNFLGCIAGLHEVLMRQGLMAGRWALDPKEDVSEGQVEEINRVRRAYPHLCDDEFVAANLEKWMRDDK
nr:dihydrodipicolinate synthase family protein [bacterium]